MGPVKRISLVLFLVVIMAFLLALAGCDEKNAEIEQPNVNQAEEPVESQRKANVADNISGTSLHEEELAQFNEIYAAQATSTDFLPVNGFFTSLYDDVTELNFVEFLYYYPADGMLDSADADEFEALSKLPDFPWKIEDFVALETLTVNDLPTPTRRILRSSVDETLQKYAGITTADLKNTEGVLYLPEYDAYYNFTSDFGPGVFTCVGGKKDGNIVRLWSDTHGYDGSIEILTLQYEDESYYIKSFQNKQFGD